MNDLIQQWEQMAGLFGILGVVFYIYVGICLTIIARKTGTSGAWMAWVPVANTVLLCHVAKRSGWWVLPMLLPVVNIVILVIVLRVVSVDRKSTRLNSSHLGIS